VGPNGEGGNVCNLLVRLFQSSVRINVGPNAMRSFAEGVGGQFQSSVRINVGPNYDLAREK